MKTHKFLVEIHTAENVNAGHVQEAVYGRLAYGLDNSGWGRDLVADGDYVQVGRVGEQRAHERYAGTSVLQDWVTKLPLMQQTVLLTAIRGPDGVRKDHVAKLVVRWLRRCVLVSAFDRCVLETPADPRGGSFTGPSIERHEYTGKAGTYQVYDSVHATGSPRSSWQEAMDDVFSAYVKATDELPHHFQMHVKNAAQIIAYKHPDDTIAISWDSFYRRVCDDLHVNPETPQQMNYRLGDSKEQWLKAGDRSSCGREDCTHDAPPKAETTVSTNDGIWNPPELRDPTKVPENVAHIRVKAFPTTPPVNAADEDMRRRHNEHCLMEHREVLHAIGIRPEGDGQEHGEIMQEIMKS